MANVRRRNDRARLDLFVLLGEYFFAHPCVDCGETDIRCLEFDHRERTSKTAEVAKMVQSSLSWTAILREIEKCDVRCANCRRIKTLQECNSWRQKAFLELQRDRQAIIEELNEAS